MKKIKIVFGVNDFTIGGMQRQFSEQIKKYDREALDITLITLFQFPGKPTLYATLPADLTIHRLAFSGIFDLPRWLELYRLLRRIQPDIVVSSLFFSNMLFRILKPFLGYVSIPREHNTYVDKPFWQRFADRVLARVSFRIVAVSKTVATFTARQEHISPGKFVVIQNGIDVEAVRSRLFALHSKESIREELGFSDSERILLNVARLTDQKNHKLLVESFAHFHRQYPSYKLAIVGGGGQLPILQRQAEESGAVDSIRFFGHQDDVWKFYKMADAFVSTSLIEGLSNAYLEALASGLPLISTMTAGTDELLEEGKNGFCIKDSTAEGASQAMELFAKADMKVLGEGASRTADAFDIRTTVAAYTALFKHAVAH